MTIHPVHPIEAESYRRLAARVDLSHLADGPRAVVARVIHASADPEFVATMRVDEASVRAGVDALRAGAPVVADVEMVRAGLPTLDVHCYLAEVPAVGPDDTRAAAAMRLVAERHPTGAVVVVGCAPTALLEVVRLVEAGALSPALIVGLPVGFVDAAESKELARACPVPSITNVGEKGGSAVAAAAVNALARLAHQTHEGR